MIQQNKKGFTIIELMLAMTIVSLLVIAIAVMIMQMTAIMTKGKTMKDLNAASRTINTDFTTKLNSIQTIYGWNSTTPANSFNGDVSYVKTTRGGAFCTGDFSYLWNDAAEINRGGKGQFQYSGSSDNSIRLIRIKDVSKEYCSSTSKHEKIPRNDSGVSEILSAGETGLMIYDIQFKKIDENAVSGQSLINIQYVLGTKSDEGQINANSCQPGNSNKNYCAINRFDLTVRTIGRR